MGGTPYIATLVATLALANPASGAAWSDKNERAPGEEASGRVCFVGATAPWFFGAYQEQTLGLSAEFAARGYVASRGAGGAARQFRQSHRTDHRSGRRRIRRESARRAPA